MTPPVSKQGKCSHKCVMSENGIMYYNSCLPESNQDWADSESLAVLMSAAADAAARDTAELLIKEKELESSTSAGCASTATTSSTPPLSPARPSATQKAPASAAKKRSPPPILNGSKANNICVSSNQNDALYGPDNPCRRGVRRKHEGGDGPPSKIGPAAEGHSDVVAAHYNTLEDKGLDERLKSRIFYMRSFNNWIKSMLINEYLNKVKDSQKHNPPVRVMDMCCGKGGDLLKWRKGNISYLICTDIASVSLEQCESRYNEMCARERAAGRVYRAEFISADCTKVRLREKYRDPSIRLDLVSCQFAFHYSFESLAQAECMVRNAAECLQPGGYFIGTIPDANVIVARQRRAAARSFGNDVYQIEFLCDTDMPPLFGAKYNFHLDGVVDCPEFLVHFPTFVKLARNFGLELVRVETFPEFYKRMKPEGHLLLQKMQCLESYPGNETTPLLGNPETDYRHADAFYAKHGNGHDRLGTLSMPEWEAVSLYLVFAFKKAKTVWGPNNEQRYDFT